MQSKRKSVLKVPMRLDNLSTHSIKMTELMEAVCTCKEWQERLLV